MKSGSPPPEKSAATMTFLEWSGVSRNLKQDFRLANRSSYVDNDFNEGEIEIVIECEMPRVMSQPGYLLLEGDAKIGDFMTGELKSSISKESRSSEFF